MRRSPGGSEDASVVTLWNRLCHNSRPVAGSSLTAFVLSVVQYSASYAFRQSGATVAGSFFSFFSWTFQGLQPSGTSPVAAPSPSAARTTNSEASAARTTPAVAAAATHRLRRLRGPAAASASAVGLAGTGRPSSIASNSSGVGRDLGSLSRQASTKGATRVVRRRVRGRP